MLTLAALDAAVGDGAGGGDTAGAVPACALEDAVGIACALGDANGRACACGDAAGVVPN